MSRAGNAALLSFVVPGLGQVYNGDLLRGVFWFFVATVFYSTTVWFLGPLSLMGFIGHALPAYTAYQRSIEKHGR